MGQAQEFYESALGALKSAEARRRREEGEGGPGAGGDGGEGNGAIAGDVAAASFLVATSGVPIFYESVEHIAQVRLRLP